MAMGALVGTEGVDDSPSTGLRWGCLHNLVSTPVMGAEVLM